MLKCLASVIGGANADKDDQRRETLSALKGVLREAWRMGGAPRRRTLVWDNASTTPITESEGTALTSSVLFIHRDTYLWVELR